MTIKFDGRDLTVTHIKKLGLAEASQFGTKLRSALPEGARNVFIDLAHTTHMDCGGLGALIAFYNQARSSRCRAVRVMNPRPSVQRLFQLTKTERLFS